MNRRLQKQLIIALVFFAILGGIGYGAVAVLVPPTPTPTPDPTAQLAPLQISLTQLLPVQETDYDVVFRVINPNTEYGSGRVAYDLVFTDSAGQPIETKSSSFYILPGQTRYVVVSPIRLAQSAAAVEVRITNPRWQQLDVASNADSTDLIIRETRSNLQEVDHQPGLFGTVSGSVTNNSDFDLNHVDVQIVALNADGQPIAVNATDIRTFLARTTRGFEAKWFVPFEGEVFRVDVEAHTNIFENSNFLKQQGGQEQFQEF